MLLIDLDEEWLIELLMLLLLLLLLLPDELVVELLVPLVLVTTGLFFFFSPTTLTFGEVSDVDEEKTLGDDEDELLRNDGDTLEDVFKIDDECWIRLHVPVEFVLAFDDDDEDEEDDDDEVWTIAPESMSSRRNSVPGFKNVIISLRKRLSGAAESAAGNSR